jgi:hypothetical protein
MAHDSAAPDRNQRPPHPGAPGAAASRSARSSALSCGERHAKAKRVPDDILAAMGAAPPLLGASAILGNPRYEPEPDPAARYPIGNIVRLSEITPDPIRWLSSGRLAAGKITVIDRDPRPSKTL